jgi:N-acetylneuraminate synthase
MNNAIFENLFILELANNHWGRLERGLRIVNDFAQVVRFNNVRAAIKLQFREVDHFIHKDFRGREDIRYIKKTEATRLSKAEYRTLVKAIKERNCIPMATAFDEASVDLCEELDLPIIKIASSDINDWFLIERIAETRKPVIVSTGGSTQKDIDDMVTFFANRNIPLAVNHCVSIYPSEDDELELNQIDFLRQRYPKNVIGLSSHEYHDWTSSMLLSYAKGARTWERHIDIEEDGIPSRPTAPCPTRSTNGSRPSTRRSRCAAAPAPPSASPRRRRPNTWTGWFAGSMRSVTCPPATSCTTRTWKTTSTWRSPCRRASCPAARQ